MGNVLHQSLTKEESEIIILDKEAPQVKAIKNSAVIPHTPLVENISNVNAENALIPFEANFENNIGYFDLMAMLSEFEGNNSKEKLEKKSKILAVTSTNIIQGGLSQRFTISEIKKPVFWRYFKILI